MTLRAGSRQDKEQWIDALSNGATSTPLATRMPLDFSEEIPPSPRIFTDSLKVRHSGQRQAKEIRRASAPFISETVLADQRAK